MLEPNLNLEFKEGNIPLILSVPHGGILECYSISKRSTGVIGIDRGTIQFSKDLIEKLVLKYKDESLDTKIPSYFFSNVRRSKIDLNREEREAYNQNSNIAKEIYKKYHQKCDGVFYCFLFCETDKISN